MVHLIPKPKKAFYVCAKLELDTEEKMVSIK